jgi:hypothetical protein
VAAPAERPPLVLVDAANVVGSVPDGWWRDRRGAATRLRDGFARLAADGLPGGGAPEWARRGPLEIVMVVEGRARGVASTATVRVVEAPGSGDDLLVDLVRREGAGRRCLVVTADNPLRARVVALGAEVAGPGTVRPREAR